MRGFSPLDQELHLAGESSEGVRQAVVENGALYPCFKLAATRFSRLTGVPVSPSTAQQWMDQYGGRLVRHEAQVAAQAAEPPPVGAPGPGPHAAPPPAQVAMSQDGTIAWIGGRWREVKVSTISRFVSKPASDGQSEPQVHLSTHSYCAGVWDRQELNRHFWWDLQRRGADRSPCQAALGDAAPWIWENMAEAVPQAHELIDWWHSTEYFWGVANALFGEETPAGKQWMAPVEDALWHEDLPAVRQAIAALPPTTDEGRAVVRRALAYLDEHTDRLHYAQFRRAGYPLGSGTVESGCKSLVGQRLKQAGQRWSERGANAVLAVRCAQWSDRWTEAWEAIYWPTASPPTTS